MILLQILSKSYKTADEYHYKIRTSLEQKRSWETSFDRGEGLIYLKNVTCPDYPDFNMHLNSKNWNWYWSFWAQLSCAQPLISTIWQLILCILYRRKWMFWRYRTAHSKAAMTNSIRLKKKPESCCKHIKVLGLLNRETCRFFFCK